MSQEAHKQLFDNGMKVRREVLGDAYVDRSIANGSSEFAKPMQEYVSEACWGSIWTRPGLDKKHRSMLNLAMLTALNRSNELAIHTRGAIRNGVTEQEISEILLQAACYAGVPAGIEAFKVSERVIKEMKENGEI